MGKLGNFVGDVFKGGVETIVRPFETISGNNFYDPTYNTKAGQTFQKFDGLMDKATQVQMIVGSAVLGVKGLGPKGQPVPDNVTPTAARQPSQTTGPDPKLFIAGGGALLLILLVFLISK